MLSPLRNRAGKRLREPFGKAGLTVAVIALVFAMLGGAYAASGLNSKQKKEVKAIAKGLQGTGPAGPQGPAGANGKDGANGSNGSSGSNGESVVLAAAGSCGAPGGTKLTVGGVSKEVCNGAPGADGNPGESPEGFPFTGEKTVGSVTCHEGGVEYEVSGEQNLVCNGEKGVKGDTGEPWTAGGTLPVGSTETGAWAFTGQKVQTFTAEVAGSPTEITVGDAGGILVSLSFPIELPATLASANVHFQSDANFSEFNAVTEPGVGCKGTAATPTAPSGHLCVYFNNEGITNTTFEGIHKAASAYSPNSKGANRTGAALQFSAPTGEAKGSGTFAVTG